MRGPFATHLREAIVLNRERLPLYSRLTGGAAEPISRRLIRAELLSLPVARYFDRRGQLYEKAGVPLLSEAFVSMEQTPPFRAPGPLPPPPPVLLTLREARRLAAFVWRAHRRDGFGGASTVLEQALGNLAAFPCYACMVRHLLESALRIANLASRHAAEAERAGLPTPAGLSRRLLWIHLIALAQSASLDRQAAPARLTERAARHPDRAAIIEYRRGRRRTVSFGELARRVAALGAGFRADGVASGDRVLVATSVVPKVPLKSWTRMHTH